MKISELVTCLESFAPSYLQEHYDNSGLLTGMADWECTGVLVSLDTTEAVVREAVEKKCNLILSHHPFIFESVKKINGKTWVEKVIIAAVKQDIAIYALHTNLDNVLQGVNGKIADKLGLVNRKILSPRQSTLEKLFVFVPTSHTDQVRNAIFQAGAGQIGNYSECSFSTGGIGTFKAGVGTDPFVGEPGKRHEETETRIEVVLPANKRQGVVAAMIQSHPYEEVAYDVLSLGNPHPGLGSGLIGELPEQIEEKGFLASLKEIFAVPVIRHTKLNNRSVLRVAVCGGAGSFLISKALAAKADFYITADLKYHEFFAAEGKLVLADIGHFESEQFTIDLLSNILTEKFPTFAIQKTTGSSNPVYYFL